MFAQYLRMDSSVIIAGSKRRSLAAPAMAFIMKTTEPTTPATTSCMRAMTLEAATWDFVKGTVMTILIVRMT